MCVHDVYVAILEDKTDRTLHGKMTYTLLQDLEKGGIVE